MNKGEFYTLAERYLKRADLSDLYDTFLQMAEARINQVARLSEMEFRSQSTPTSAFWNLPADFVEMRHIQAELEGQPRPLEYVVPETADKVRRITSGQQGYQFYTLLNNQIELIPHPNSESTAQVEMFYYAKVPALTQAQETNLILTNYPNLYLYAFMAEAALYRESIQAAQSWLASFDAYMQQLNTSAAAGRYSGNALQLRAI